MLEMYWLKTCNEMSIVTLLHPPYRQSLCQGLEQAPNPQLSNPIV